MIDTEPLFTVAQIIARQGKQYRVVKYGMFAASNPEVHGGHVQLCYGIRQQVWNSSVQRWVIPVSSTLTYLPVSVVESGYYDPEEERKEQLAMEPVCILEMSSVICPMADVPQWSAWMQFDSGPKSVMEERAKAELNLGTKFRVIEVYSTFEYDEQ